VKFAAAGLTVTGLLGLVAAAIPPFGFHLVLFGGAIVVDVMFGLWLCVLCQICQIHCFCGGMIFPTGDVAKEVAIGNFCFLQVLCCTKESKNV
jgi:hypothetical protein